MLKMPAWGGLIEELAAAVNLTELTKGSTVWLAVTGLSRAGKTVFITSLIHNLLSAVHNPNRMPLFKVVGEGRMRSVRLETVKSDVLPRFPYGTNIEAMAEMPSRWPERTVDISEIGIDIRYEPAGLFGQMLAKIGGDTATLSLRIVDYPGEWLLDLPLLGMSYAEWSRAMLKLWRQGVRAEIGRDFLARVAEISHADDASEQTARELHEFCRGMLIAARDKLLARLPVTGEMLRGSLLKRTIRNHAKGCAKCASGEGHRMSVLTVSYPGGRTRQFSLRGETALQVRRWLANYQRLKQGIEAICELNHDLLRPNKAAAGSRRKRL